MGVLSVRMGTRKQYPAEIKAKIVLEILKEEKSIFQIASEYGIHPSVLNRWKNTAVEKLPSLFTDETKSIENMKSEYEKKIQDLYAEVGRLTTELTWLKKKSGL
jgi:transposase-like protein